VRPLGQIKSVRVTDLDREHERCAAALRILAQTRSRAALSSVFAEYQAHFAHEEALLDQWLYAQQSCTKATVVAFDASAGQRRSHFADHKRLIADLSAQLSERDAEELPAAFVDKVLRDFETHANTYDDTYAEPLAQAIAAASA